MLSMRGAHNRFFFTGAHTETAGCATLNGGEVSIVKT